MRSIDPTDAMRRARQRAGSARALDMAEIQLRDAMQRAQALAMSNRSPYAVVFGVATDRFAVVNENGQVVAGPLTKLPWIVDFTRPNQPKRVEIERVHSGVAGVAAIFDSQGVPLVGGSLTLRHMELRQALVMDAATGRLAAP
jgi:hypothetical protein